MINHNVLDMNLIYITNYLSTIIVQSTNPLQYPDLTHKTIIRLLKLKLKPLSSIDHVRIPTDRILVF